MAGYSSPGGGGNAILLNGSTRFEQTYAGPTNNQWSKVGTILGKAKILSVFCSSYSGQAHSSNWEFRDKDGTVLEAFNRGGGASQVVSGFEDSRYVGAAGVIVEDVEIWQKSYANAGYAVSNNIKVGGVLL